MIKVLIACNSDDILLRKLKDNAQIEVETIVADIQKIIQSCQIISPDILILDFDEFECKLRKEEIIENIYKIYLNKYIIISVINSKIYLCFDKINSLLDLIKFLDSQQDINYSILENNIYDMFWKLRFNLYSKGTVYLKDAIILAYQNNELLYNTNELIHQTALLHNLDEKNIRNNIDNALNLAFKYDNINYDITFFDGLYDGRKISLKYFIVLSVHYLKQLLTKI